MKQLQTYLQFLLLAMAIILMQGCESAPEITTIPTTIASKIAVLSTPVSTTPSVEQTPTVLPTKIITDTPHPTATEEPTASEIATATVEPTLSPSPAPTWTPLPTLLPMERQELLTSWLEQPPCQLPCWWGVEPGVTSWPETTQLLNKIRPDIYRPSFPQEFIFQSIPNTSNYLRSTFRVEDEEHVRLIAVKIQQSPYYGLLDFLEEYGKPDDLLMTVSHGTSSGHTIFHFVLGYWESGIAVSYEDRVEYQVTKEWSMDAVGCMHGLTEINMVLWDTNSLTYGPDDVYSLQLLSENSPYKTLEEATGLTIDDFYNANKEAVYPICVSTPLELWQLQ